MKHSRAIPAVAIDTAPNEVVWFDTLQDTLDEVPESESEFIGEQLSRADRSRFLLEEHDLKA